MLLKFYNSTALYNYNSFHPRIPVSVEPAYYRHEILASRIVSRERLKEVKVKEKFDFHQKDFVLKIIEDFLQILFKFFLKIKANCERIPIFLLLFDAFNFRNHNKLLRKIEDELTHYATKCSFPRCEGNFCYNACLSSFRIFPKYNFT